MYLYTYDNGGTMAAQAWYENDILQISVICNNDILHQGESAYDPNPMGSQFFKVSFSLFWRQIQIPLENVNA